MRRLFAAALIAGLACAGAWAEQDPLRRLEEDSSPKASARLKELYRRSQDRDQRFWVVQALGGRLRVRGDAEAAEGLLEAFKDREPDVRRQALRALSYFTALPRKALSAGLVGRLDAVVRKAEKDSSQSVRSGAAELREALKRYHAVPAVSDEAQSGEETSAEPDVPGGRRWTRLFLLAWIVFFPVLLSVWALRGFPVFSRGPEGRLARSLWRRACSQPGRIAFTLALWSILAVLVSIRGFELMARWANGFALPSAGGLLAAYLAAGFCVLAPGVLFCEGERDGDWACSLLHAAVLTFAVFLFLAPAELFYRLFLRPVPREDEPVSGGFIKTALRCGSLRTAYRACAGMIQGGGLVPALRQGLGAGPAGRLNFLVFDGRFESFFAGPLAFGFCAVVGAAVPSQWTAASWRLALGASVWFLFVRTVLLFAALQPLEGLLAAAENEEETA
ncbi:MAG: HEAT repeat domain-containing protein [Elusimicrobiota bacterium]|jgi:hypothetical protein